MSRRQTFDDFDWKVERSAFVKALPGIFPKILVTAAVFLSLFVSLVWVLGKLF